MHDPEQIVLHALDAGAAISAVLYMARRIESRLTHLEHTFTLHLLRGEAMGILDEIRAAGVEPSDWPAVVLYIGRLPIPRDRREGFLRLAASATNRVPTLAEIEQVRAAPSP